jgi:urease accessory protein
VNSSFLTKSTSVPGWQGHLQLKFALRYGKTQPIYVFSQAPLKVQRPFYPEGIVCHNVVLHTAGGIVGGDQLTQQIHLEPDAIALITTAAAGKVYRSNGKLARQLIHIQLETGACLEWLPQETIMFNGAIYRQDLRVELAPGAIWLGWDITRYGRSARGEVFLQGEWRSHTEVWQQGRPLWIERQYLPASATILESDHGLAGQPVIATLAWVGQSVSSEIVEQARNLWTASDRQGEAGVTQLQLGLLCRYRGNSTIEAKNWFTDVWQLLRLSMLKRKVTKPRVWQV